MIDRKHKPKRQKHSYSKHVFTFMMVLEILVQIDKKHLFTN